LRLFVYYECIIVQSFCRVKRLYDKIIKILYGYGVLFLKSWGYECFLFF